VFFSNSPEEIYRQWEKPEKPKIPNLERVQSGEHFEAIIIVANCAANATGHCRVTSDWRIRTSEGQLLGSPKGVRTYFDHKAGVPGHFLIAEHGVGMAPEKDFAGSYVFEVVVRDEVGGKSVTLRRQIGVGREQH
jgi:hypothetical protein